MRYIIFTFFLFLQSAVYSQTTGDYQSKQSGSWHDLSSWQTFNGSTFVDATIIPSQNSGVITVRNGHTITINNVSAGDQIIVAQGGTLVNAYSLSILDGSGDDLVVNGVLVNSNGYFSGGGTVGNIVINGEMNWNGGGSDVSISNKGTVNFSGGLLRRDQILGTSTTFTNDGVFNWNSGTFNFNLATFANTKDGIFNINSNDQIYNVNGGYFINEGTLIKKNSNGTTSIGIGLNNTGTIKGIGTYNFPGFTNAGTIEPGTSTGILQIIGNQPFSSSSNLLLEIKDGSGPGTGHDQFLRNENLTLAGTLKVVKTGNVPPGEYVIIEVSTGNISGSFSTYDLPEGCSIITNPTNIVLKVVEVDSDKDGVLDSKDCAPNDATVWRTGTFYVDADGDGYTLGNAVNLCYGATTPSGYKPSSLGTDCNDQNATVWRTGTFYVDADGDGYTVGAAVNLCYGASIPSGYKATSLGTDCNDNEASVWRTGTFYIDADGDGYTVGSAVNLCYGAATPSGYKPSSLGTDCNDSDASVWRAGTFYIDADGDGYTVGSAINLCYGTTTPKGYSVTQKGTDCNDNNAAIHPGAIEICGNGIDENCDGKDGVCAPTDTDGDGVPDADDCSPSDPTTWRLVTLYSDSDFDGAAVEYGTEMCIGADIPLGYSEDPGSDCDDSDNSVWRKVILYADNDGDGASAGAGIESCIGLDIPLGYTEYQGFDCNDHNADIYPGAPELCDALDNNCNGQVDEGLLFWIYPDNDGDGYGTEEGKIYSCSGSFGYSEQGGDCRDDDYSIHPGAEEICDDGIDNDCDGQIDEDCSVPEPTIYYSKAGGDLHNVLSWGVNPDGSGVNPTDFGAGKTFNLANRSGNYTMTGNWTVAGTLVNPSGSQLKISGYTLSLIALTGAGTLTGSTSSNLVIAGTDGGNFGNINFTSGGGMLKALTLNRSGSGAAATIGTPVGVYDVLTITNGALTTGGNLTLKSTATGTARVAAVTGTISGNVTVERYIPARRAWRLMNAPVDGTQTVNQAWQEGATTASANPNPASGYGTYITAGTVANGFDQNIQGMSTSSLKSFNSAGILQPVTNTKTALVSNKPYMAFIRGDRSVTLRDNNVPPNNTTLRSTGLLLTGNQTIPVAASGFTAVANPFASPINFASITRNNVSNGFYVWDPKMGGANGVGAYVNISFNGTGYDITPASVSPESQFIQSGQSFLVQSTGAAGSLVIKESDKAATPSQNVFREQSGTIGALSGINGELVFAPARNAIGLRMNLQIADGSQRGILDEVFASYSSSFSDNIDNMDALKVDNVMENISIIRNGRALMVDRRNWIKDADTLKLSLSNTSASTYMFEFSPIDLSGAESVTLIDHYLQTNTDISVTAASQVYFQVGRDSKSSAADRFSVIIVNRKGLPGIDIAGKPGIRAYPNPIMTNGNVYLQFDNIKAGSYKVDVVNSLGQVVYSRIMQLNNGSVSHQLNIGSRLPSGVYQVRITGKDTRTVIKVMKK